MLFQTNFLVKVVPWVSATMLTVTMIAGCGGGKVQTLPAAKVTGTVTYKGQPVEGAMVMFVSDEVPITPTGTTDAQGKFTLTTNEPGDGAPPAMYNVLVTKYPNIETPDTTADPLNPQPVEGTDTPTESKNELPDIYSSVLSTSLQAFVEDGKENHFDFDLGG